MRRSPNRFVQMQRGGIIQWWRNPHSRRRKALALYIGMERDALAATEASLEEISALSSTPRFARR